ncbi:hypothetical protein HYV64_00740 [Candidatus Shapirobacteria bacterium]|nr:hypothetical protein [Candidatus Shapirobacteria bacterium]
MESYSLSLLTKKLLESGLTLVNSQTLRSLLGIKNERTYYRIVKDFIKNNVLISIEKNKYSITGKSINTFEIANFLYQPSYVSLETALNHWGVLSQFPFEITNITSKKSVKKNIDGKIYSYNHIAPKYFGMFTKKNNILIALPEKALFDQLYLASKGLKSINFDEYDFKKISKNIFFDICHQLKADQSLMNLVKNLK